MTPHYKVFAGYEKNFVYAIDLYSLVQNRVVIVGDIS